MFNKFESRCELGWKSAYAMLDWKRRTHHDRLKRFIDRQDKKLLCQDCGGSGQVETDHIEGVAIYNTCDWCEGIGYLTPYVTR